MSAPAYRPYECPGHVASNSSAKICGRCGLHIDSERPIEEAENLDEVEEQGLA